uniref:Uncharacterized protein n=1 Tax=Myoviridae sp. ctshb19 TaxID=2825194 RepID=A0A8S5UGY5_9CAUD|nr:MAG TPA: hypothetical protein [Myoviridae sp. ctshb19]
MPNDYRNHAKAEGSRVGRKPMALEMGRDSSSP